jgi:exodeoxyribonuclease VII small subunit
MENKNYSAAFEELQQIVQEMESGEIGIDALSIKVKRASELIQFCKDKLKTTELDVEQILNQLESDSDNTTY